MCICDCALIFILLSICKQAVCKQVVLVNPLIYSFLFLLL